jgi:hypothetical protein
LLEEEVDDAKYVALDEINEIIVTGNATTSLGEIIRLHNNGIIKVKENRKEEIAEQSLQLDSAP